MQHKDFQDTEFYIGWQAEAPKSFAKAVRRFLLGLVLFVPLVALLTVYFQNGFSTGTFDFGKKTELEGILSEKPVPFLTIQTGQDVAGKPVYQKILLVAPGKFGAEKVLDQMRTYHHSALDGKRVKISGFLIYNDGKTALELTEGMASFIEVNEKMPDLPANPALGTVTLRGEVTDPKCLLGVMKPGQGKPHRDCAIRCISGGIPPVLKVANAAGETEYYILVGPNGEPVNERILDYVADGVQVCGRLEQDGDWLILYTDLDKIQRINKGALNPGITCN